MRMSEDQIIDWKLQFAFAEDLEKFEALQDVMGGFLFDDGRN